MKNKPARQYFHIDCPVYAMHLITASNSNSTKLLASSNLPLMEFKGQAGSVATGAEWPSELQTAELE
jgi:hypothetical protein